MTDFSPSPNSPLDPEQLADLLDALLPPNAATITPPATDDALLAAAARLAAAPRPELSTAALARIHARLNADQRSRTRTRMERAAARLVPLLLAGLVVIGLLVSILVFSRASSEGTPTPTATASPSPTVTASPSGTPTMTASPLPTATASVTTAATTAPTPSSTATALPETATTTSAPPLLEALPTGIDAAPVALVLEGTVEAIADGMITIYDFTVLLPPEDPLAQAVQVGDVVRVMGVLQGAASVGDALLVTATTLDIVNIVVYVNPATGAVFRDDAPCANRPPSWAAAVGWRARCQPTGTRPPAADSPIPIPEAPPPPANPPPGGEESGGSGRGDDDDDDDD